MRELTEHEIHLGKETILKIVDSSVFNIAIDMLKNKLGHDILVAGTIAEREAIFSEYNVLNRFANTLTEIANSIRGSSSG